MKTFESLRGNSASSLSTPTYDFGSYLSAVQAANWQTNQFNAEQAAINRDWQEYMSNTSHQREMQDLQKAGLNPILAANSGASTPSGATASGSDSSGAIAGLLGQMISAQSAQAVADRNNAAARLLEVMREEHDTYIHQNYPSSLWTLAGALTSSPVGQALGLGNSASSVSEKAQNGLSLFFNPWRALPGWSKVQNWFRKAFSR